METTNNILVQIQNLNVLNVNNTAERPAAGGEVLFSEQTLIDLLKAEDKTIAAQATQITKLMELYQVLLDKYLALKEEHGKLLRQLPEATEK